MITAFTDPTVASCQCVSDDDTDVLRCLVAAGYDQWEVSHLLWGDPTRVSLETQLAYAAHQARGVRDMVQAAFGRAFPWLRLPTQNGATA